MLSNGTSLPFSALTCLATSYFCSVFIPSSWISGTFLKQVRAEQLPDTPWQMQAMVVDDSTSYIIIRL